MPKARPFPFAGSQAGVFHVVSRIAGREFVLGPEEKDFFVRIMRAYEDLLGVEVLTWCIMSNHFHLLVRVPDRPGCEPDSEQAASGSVSEISRGPRDGGSDSPERHGGAAVAGCSSLDGPDLDTLLRKLQRAVGREQFRLIRRQLEMWRSAGEEACIETWRQRQLRRMYSLSEFVRCLKQRFTRWYNRRNGRCGVLWEGRFSSVIVEEEQRALRTISAYIDLNPVRAGLVNNPADYRWCGYAAAMRGEVRAQQGLVKVAGPAAWSVATERRGRGMLPAWDPLDWNSWPEVPAAVRRRALILYRNLLAVAGTERRREDGTLARHGLSESEREKLLGSGGLWLAAGVAARRVRHFTAGVILGSREFVDRWFESNRWWFGGRSRVNRRTGARSMGLPALRGVIYSLRALRKA